MLQKGGRRFRNRELRSIIDFLLGRLRLEPRVCARIGASSSGGKRQKAGNEPRVLRQIPARGNHSASFWTTNDTERQIHAGERAQRRVRGERRAPEVDAKTTTQSQRYHRAWLSWPASLAHRGSSPSGGHMSTIPDCPYCHSPGVHRLNAAVTGVAGYRCDACEKIFYVASAHVAKRIEDARPRPDAPEDEQPLRGTVRKKE